MLDRPGSAARAAVFKINGFARGTQGRMSANRRHRIALSSRGVELLVDRSTELQGHYRFMRNAETVTDAFVKKSQVGFAGQDQAGDRLVEQGADGQDGFGPRMAIAQSVVGNQDVRPAVQLPDPGDRLLSADGGRRPAGPTARAVGRGTGR